MINVLEDGLTHSGFPFQALKENFKSLKKISSLLLRSVEPLVNHTAATLYK